MWSAPISTPSRLPRDSSDATWTDGSLGPITLTSSSSQRRLPHSLHTHIMAEESSSVRSSQGSGSARRPPKNVSFSTSTAWRAADVLTSLRALSSAAR